jgi:hypothetical protein
MRRSGINELISFENLHGARNRAFTPSEAKLPCAAVFAGAFTHH